jgi:hypothetical protein
VPDLVAPWVRSCQVSSRPERSTHGNGETYRSPLRTV